MIVDFHEVLPLGQHRRLEPKDHERLQPWLEEVDRLTLRTIVELETEDAIVLRLGQVQLQFIRARFVHRHFQHKLVALVDELVPCAKMAAMAEPSTRLPLMTTTSNQ